MSDNNPSSGNEPLPGGNTVRDMLRRAAENVPPPAATEGEEAAIRHATFWRNGFSFGDGQLLEYGDPANEQLLVQLNSGIAPTHMLNIKPGQLVELHIAKRLSEDYIPPPKAPSGSGSPAPEEGPQLRRRTWTGRG
ncbi:SEP domain-containing protein [Hygrophoropsis aurantiaca]|uniref:SEP domain-containing protein n=1 Tax=Hygrophoropsis aurantiaca TaxID=72124 RepID=A0ACB7ZT35_9AGAM|nr:SEP domain-containing protein [Hygrophoropsis aurantiaca]